MSTKLPSGGSSRRSFHGLLLFLFALAFLLGACGSDADDSAATSTDTESAGTTDTDSTTEAEETTEEEETVEVEEAAAPAETQSFAMQLAWLKNMQFPGPYMATEQGYYDQYGLDVELLGGGPSVDSITVVASGNALIGMADSNELAVARGQGIPVVSLGAAFQKSPFGMITMADAPIDTLEGMYGKTVAVSDSSRPTVEALMEREGLDPSQVDFVPKNPDPSVLVDGAVDAYWGFVSSEGAVLRSRGVDVVWTLLADLGEPTYANVYFVMEETLEENRDLVVSIMAADLAGWTYSVNNIEDTVRITESDYQTEDGEYDIMIQQHTAQVELIDPTGSGDLLTLDPDIFVANIESAIDGGLLDEAYDVNEVLDLSVLEDARALAGEDAVVQEAAPVAAEPVEIQSFGMQLAWLKNMQFPGPYMAIEQGYYDQFGLDVELLGGGPSVDSITVVASGNALIGMADSNELAVARGQGIPVVSLGAAFQKSPFGMITMADAPIDTLEGMYGKTVAVSDSSRPTVEALMEREGLDPSQVDFVPKNPDPSVLVDGVVDAYWGFVSSEGAVLASRGEDVVWTLLSDLGEPTYANVYFVMEETLEENRDLVVSIMAADLAGWTYSVENIEDTVRITESDYQTEDGEYDIMIQQHTAQVELIDPTGSGELLTLDPDIFVANIESAISGGLLDEAYDVNEVLDLTVLEDARALLGE